jgi:hypothetical protein
VSHSQLPFHYEHFVFILQEAGAVRLFRRAPEDTCRGGRLGRQRREGMQRWPPGLGKVPIEAVRRRIPGGARVERLRRSPCFRPCVTFATGIPDGLPSPVEIPLGHMKEML